MISGIEHNGVDQADVVIRKVNFLFLLGLSNEVRRAG